MYVCVCAYECCIQISSNGKHLLGEYSVYAALWLQGKDESKCIFTREAVYKHPVYMHICILYQDSIYLVYLSVEKGNETE